MGGSERRHRSVTLRKELPSLDVGQSCLPSRALPSGPALLSVNFSLQTGRFAGGEEQL